MLNNYQYFIALAEECNISKAAEKLFISHQCLSKYLKNLEAEYHIDFFDRTPKLELTQAGRAYLDMVRQIQMLEDNLGNQLDDIRQAKRGLLRFGTTEGRYRILVPHLLPEFKHEYPEVVLSTQSGTSAQLSEAIIENALDIALLNQNDKSYSQLDFRPVMEEHIFLVISDNMLKAYFPALYPQCIDRFRKGINLKDFQHVPFVLGPSHLNMPRKLQEYLRFQCIQLNIISEIAQSDLQYMLTAEDYAASFCWSMYLPTVHAEQSNNTQNCLYTFPLNDCNITNQLWMATRKGKIFQDYGKAFMKLIKRICISYSEYLIC